MEQLKVFIEKAKTDSDLAAKLDALGVKKASDDEVIALAVEYGFTFTKEDMAQMRSPSKLSTLNELSEEEQKHCGSCKLSTPSKLSEEELESISGGEHDRHNHEICRQYKMVHYYCVGFFGVNWCKYYERTYSHPVKEPKYEFIFRHKCQKNYYDYNGTINGAKSR